MIRTVLAAAAVALVGAAIPAALAQQDIIKTRQDLMKRSGQQAAVLNRMVRGQDEFDVTKVNAAFDALEDKAKRLPDLFPPGSQTGETRASPKIWDDSAGFKAAIDQFAKDVADGRPKAVAGLDGLKAAVPAVAKNCGGCHEAFRLPPRT